MWFREEQLARAQAGEDVDVSLSSIRRWGERLHPYRQTGNKAREQVVGVDLINLVTFLRAWPEATLDEMAVFLYNEGGPLYSKQVLSKRLAELEIAKKRAPTEAYQAQREDVQFRVWSFFNCPSPLGIFQVTSMSLLLRWRSANARGVGHLESLGFLKMGTTILVPRSWLYLRSSRGIQGSPRTFTEVCSVLGVGFGVCMAVGQQPTFFVISVITFVPRLSSLGSKGRMTIVFLFGTTWRLIIWHMCTRP